MLSRVSLSVADALADVRRQVLRRRRPLAAVLAAVAVASGLAAAREGPAPTVEVVVAARDLPAGAVLGPDDLEPVAFAPGSVPSGLAADAAGRVLAGPVTRGQPVTEVALVGASMTAGRTDLVAMPVRLPDAGAVALLRVGDELDLTAVEPQSGTTSDVVARGVVLALPAPDDEVGVSGLPGRLVVLGVREGEVTRLADAVSRSVVTFAWSNR